MVEHETEALSSTPLHNRLKIRQRTVPYKLSLVLWDRLEDIVAVTCTIMKRHLETGLCASHNNFFNNSHLNKVRTYDCSDNKVSDLVCRSPNTNSVRYYVARLQHLGCFGLCWLAKFARKHKLRLREQARIAPEITDSSLSSSEGSLAQQCCGSKSQEKQDQDPDPHCIKVKSRILIQI